MPWATYFDDAFATEGFLGRYLTLELETTTDQALQEDSADILLEASVFSGDEIALLESGDNILLESGDNMLLETDYSQKVSQMSTATPAGDDLFAAVDDPSGTPVTKKISRDALWRFIDPRGLYSVASPSSVDDEFVTDTTGDYTEVTPSGAVTWTHGRHGIVAQCQTTGGSDDVFGLVKSGTVAVGESLETAVSIVGHADNYTMAGICLADGTDTTSNIAGVWMYLSDDVTQLRRVQSRIGTFAVSSTTGTTVECPRHSGLRGPIRLRIRHGSSGVFTMEMSVDGVTWVDPGMGTVSEGHSFDRIGFMFSHLGALAGQGFARFEYLRVTS